MKQNNLCCRCGGHLSPARHLSPASDRDFYPHAERECFTVMFDRIRNIEDAVRRIESILLINES